MDTDFTLLPEYTQVALTRLMVVTGVKILYFQKGEGGEMGDGEYYDEYTFVDENGLVWEADDSHGLRLSLASRHTFSQVDLSKVRAFFDERDGYFLGDYQENADLVNGYTDLYASNGDYRRERHDKRKLFQVIFGHTLYDLISKSNLALGELAAADPESGTTFWEHLAGMLFDYRESIRGRGNFDYDSNTQGIMILLNLLFTGSLK